MGSNQRRAKCLAGLGYGAVIFICWRASPSPAAVSLTWTGAVSQGWDTSHANWIDSSGNPQYFANGDPVTFADIAGQTSGSIIVGNTNDGYGGVSPGGVTINSTNTAYTFMYSPIDGTGGLLKTGSGNATLDNGPNFYYGSTVISGGTLSLQTNSTNIISTSPDIVIGASGIFDVTQVTGTGSSGVQGFNLSRNQVIGGTGTVKGNVVVDSTGTISAGTFTSLNTGSADTVGTLTTDSQTWDEGGTYVWKVSDGSAGAGIGWDQMTMNNLSVTASASSPFTISVVGLDSTGIGSPANVAPGSANYEWVIAKSANAILFGGTTHSNGTILTGTASSLFTLNTSSFIENGSSVSSSMWRLEVVADGNGQDLALIYSSAPEPSAALMMSLGVMPILLGQRRPRSARI